MVYALLVLCAIVFALAVCVAKGFSLLAGAYAELADVYATLRNLEGRVQRNAALGAELTADVYNLRGVDNWLNGRIGGAPCAPPHGFANLLDVITLSEPMAG